MPPFSCCRHVVLLLCFATAAFMVATAVNAQDSGSPEALPPSADSCNGVFVTYTLMSRTREFPHVKNATAQSWAFKSVATVLNTMDRDLKAWKLFIGFQHEEILVSASGAVIVDGSDFPAAVGNGTTLAGYPQVDLLNSIDTAGDMSQIQAKIEMTGTQFGVKPPGFPMPKTLRLENDGLKCPKPTKDENTMYVCCNKDPKFKANKTRGDRFLPRQYGDLNIAYDVLQAYDNNYLAQVTIDNNSPLGRLDNWNLTWEWKRGEFIYSMRGAYTLRKDSSGCIYGDAANYYRDFDFTPVMNCQRRPVIADLPPDHADDNKIGNLPWCCRNGTLLPPTLNSNYSRSIFQLQVYKLPPDLNRTALYPPTNWRISGMVNPTYLCGAPIRVSPTEFPDPSGLMAKTYSVASWQVVCNITRPKARQSRCCVSFSAFYNDSVVPCRTCACGCPDGVTCNPDASPLLLPPEALLVPFDNRTAKAKAWANIKHRELPRPLPCGDYCSVSMNWHIFSDYRNGWTARMTIFNWGDYTFRDWFAAIKMDKAFDGYDNVYSFNGTRIPELNNTVFFQGLMGLNYLMAEADGNDPKSDPRVPGKQQSVISFSKKKTPEIQIRKGDGFPTRVYFNGEECALPEFIPTSGGYRLSSRASLMLLVLAATMAFSFMFWFSADPWIAN